MTYFKSDHFSGGGSALLISVFFYGLIANSALAASSYCLKRINYIESYAFLYVASSPAGATVTSTLDVLTLSDGTGTRTEVMFIKSRFPYREQPVGLIVYKDCFRPAFERVTINRWNRTKEEARANPHQVRPRAFKDRELCAVSA